MDPHIYRPLIFDKWAKAIQQKVYDLSKNSARVIKYMLKKMNFDHYLTPYIKIKHKPIYKT